RVKLPRPDLSRGRKNFKQLLLLDFQSKDEGRPICSRRRIKTSNSCKAKLDSNLVPSPFRGFHIFEGEVRVRAEGLGLVHVGGGVAGGGAMASTSEVVNVVASLVAAALGIACFTQAIRSLRSGVLAGRVAPIHRGRQPVGFFVGIWALALSGLI